MAKPGLAKRSTVSARALRVLHVEDRRLDAELCLRQLEEAGFKLTADVVATREEFLQKLGSNTYDIILSDYRLPGWSGMDALEIVRAETKDTPFILVTGSLGEEDAVESIKEGVTDYVLKDRPERLPMAVERALEEKSLRGAQRQAEKALRESEERYRTLFENMLEGFAYCKMLFDDRGHPVDWVYLDVNKAFERLTGLKNIIGKKVSEAIPAIKESNPELFEIYGRVVLTGQTEKFEIEVKPLAMWLTISVFSPRKEHFCTVVDKITEHKRAEEALVKLRKAVDASGEVVFMTDREGVITFVNPEFARLYGYTEEEVVGKTTPRVLKSGRRSQEDHASFWKTLLDKRVVKEEVINKTKDGRLVDIENSASPILDEQGDIKGFLAIQRDITERKQLEQQLRQVQRLEAVGRLAGGVAHDFNNLLTIVNGYSQLLLDRLPAGETMREQVEEIKSAGERAASLTRQLLAFSRQQILAPQVMDLNAAVANMDKMLRRLIGEDIELETSLGEGLGRVKADPGQIEQVIMNLAVNARDAMPQGGRVTIETANVELDEAYARAHIAVKPGPYVMLAVSDTGCGMEAETRARLFEPFFTTKEKDKGTGLGLSTVYGIVKQSGGNIWVYSEPGRGSTFKIYLPRVDDVAEAGRQAGRRLASVQGKETVLLAEDEQPVLRLVRTVLEACGYTVLEAARVEEALEISKRHEGPIHLLLTDVVMPQMSGRQLAERLATTHPETKVLYISGYADNAIVHHGVLDAGTAFLQKPFTPDTLARKVREVLDN